MSRRRLIEEDPERWEDLMRAIEDELTLYPSPHGYVPGRAPKRLLKVRPGTEGFPGLAIIFSIREGNSRMCVLEDVMISDDPDRFKLTDYIAENDAWQQSNGNRP